MRPRRVPGAVAAVLMLACLVGLTSRAALGQEGTGSGTGSGTGEESAASVESPSGHPIPAEAQALGDAELGAGAYLAAVAQYEARLPAEADNARLHFDLGLAYANLDRLGPAAYHFTQAHFLEPRESTYGEALTLLRAELHQRHAQAQAAETVTKGEPEALFWLEMFHMFRRAEVELGIIGLSWLGFGFLIWRRRLAVSVRRDAVSVVALLALLGAILLTAYRVGADVVRERVVPAVVVADQPLLREGPDRQAARGADPDLWAGATVLVLEERGNWMDVELASGSTGWLARGDARVVQAPGD